MFPDQTICLACSKRCVVGPASARGVLAYPMRHFRAGPDADDRVLRGSVVVGHTGGFNAVN
eukprot:1516635-Lingulodinium_polyedra.AAC.1